METKHIYIILALVVVAFAGFMGYRHFNTTSEMQTHREDTYKRLTERAQKSPRVGMADMGRALKRYYAAHNSFPETLAALYPEYISGRSFIDDVKWNYRLEGNDFSLSKSVETGGKTLTAYMNSSLKTQVETGTMVAIRNTRKTPSAVTGKGGDTSSSLRLIAGMKLLTALKMPDFQLDEIVKTDEVGPLRNEPRSVAVEENITLPAFAASVSRSYLVWRDTTGNIGFGNVQYPYVDRISIASQDRWLRVERQPVEGGESGVPDSPAIVQDPADGFLSTGLAGSYLAWRDAQGAIGFGNVQYPEKKNLLLYTDSKWEPVTPIDQSVTATVPEELSGSVEKAGERPKQVAERFGRRYLAWKDKNGAIGIGNVQYPDPGDIAYIYVNGSWEAFENSKPL
jgi:hypothetical protein